MTVQIHPDTEFSTGQAARMLQIEGLTTQRIKRLCDRGLVPHTKTGEHDRAAYRIKFGDFDSIVEAHAKVRTIKRGNSEGPSMEEFRELQERVHVLEQLYDLKLAPEWDDKR